MNEYAGWIEFWKWLLIVGLGSFFLLVLVVLPLGARDLVRLFRRLEDPEHERDEK